MVKIARLRNTPYVVNIKSESGIKRYEWIGSKGDKTDIRSIPEDVVNHLLMSSRCFNDGELKIIEDSDESKDIITNIDEIDKYRNNTNSKEDIKKMLDLPVAKLKTELNKITVVGEKNFVIEVAKEIGLDSSSKRKILGEWLGTPAEILFDDEE
jgi:hypothetical protein